MKVAPGGPATVYVEAAILIDDPPPGTCELLCQAGIETRFPHMDEIAAHGREMQLPALRWSSTAPKTSSARSPNVSGASPCQPGRCCRGKAPYRCRGISGGCATVGDLIRTGSGPAPMRTLTRPSQTPSPLRAKFLPVPATTRAGA